MATNQGLPSGGKKRGHMSFGASALYTAVPFVFGLLLTISGRIVIRRFGL